MTDSRRKVLDIRYGSGLNPWYGIFACENVYLPVATLRPTMQERSGWPSIDIYAERADASRSYLLYDDDVIEDALVKASSM